MSEEHYLCQDCGQRWKIAIAPGRTRLPRSIECKSCGDYCKTLKSDEHHFALSYRTPHGKLWRDLGVFETRDEAERKLDEERDLDKQQPQSVYAYRISLRPGPLPCRSRST